MNWIRSCKLSMALQTGKMGPLSSLRYLKGALSGKEKGEQAADSASGLFQSTSEQA
jgi:hypothetical protein